MAEIIQPAKRLRTKYLLRESFPYKEYNVEPTSAIPLLPNEILFLIFSYLDVHTLLTKVKLVCKAWKSLVKGPFLWKCFRSLSFIENESTPYIVKVVKKCTNLRSLKVSRLRKAVDFEKEAMHSSLFVTLTHLIQLRSLSLNNFKIGKDCEKSFVKSMTNLRHLRYLDLDKCYITKKMAETIPKLSGLKFLCLSRCYAIENDTFIKIIENCNELEHLNLSQQDTLNKSVLTSLFHLRAETIKGLVLKDISIKHKNFTNIQKCINLSVLIIDCHFLNDRTLHLIRRLPHLTHLELSFGLQFSVIGLRKLFGEGSFSQLKHLDMTCCASVDDSILEILANKCRELVSLDVAECWRITDKGIYNLLYKCGNLQFLNLEDLKELKGHFLTEIHDHLKLLKLLNLCFCDGISLNLLRKFIKLNPNFQINKCKEYRLKPVLKPYSQPSLLIFQGTEL